MRNNLDSKSFLARIYYLSIFWFICTQSIAVSDGISTVSSHNDQSLILEEQTKTGVSLFEPNNKSSGPLQIRGSVARISYPVTMRQKDKIMYLIKHINPQRLHRTVGELSLFYTRYYKSNDGLRSAEYVYKYICALIEQSNLDSSMVSVEKIQHDWLQPTIIVKVKSSKTESTIDKRIILGCHIDSTNLMFPRWLRAPGADDNASAVSSLLETLHILLIHTKENRLKHIVEFHFYSAEEGQMLASDQIFAEYKRDNVQVVAMLQQDQIGFLQAGFLEASETRLAGFAMGIVTDYTNESLNSFVKLIVSNICQVQISDSRCGYGCSDSTSANKTGYPSSLVTEGQFNKLNKFVHSPLDTIDRLDFEYIAEFVKLAVAYAVELSDFDGF